MSGDSELFGDLPEQLVPQAPGRGMPRLRQPERHQLGWYAATIDDLVARDHPVRAVWAFVQGLDLGALHDAVKAREGVPGQAPPAPELMMALWLWATVEGVGSARQLTRLCEQHLAYRWLCGGVSMNYHTLSDFRVAHAAVLDRLLAGGVATLVAQGLVALDVLAQDGIRVRVAAGAGSFRRRERLGKLAAAATARVERTRTSNGRMRAASNCGARRCTASTAAILTRRGPTTNRGWRTGAGAWPASRVRLSTSNAPRPSAQRLGAPHGAHPAVGARQREGPRHAAVVRARPQHAACLGAAAGRQGCYKRHQLNGQWPLLARSRLALHPPVGRPDRPPAKPSSSAARQMPSPNPLHQTD